jgi:hypothetical protein
MTIRKKISQGRMNVPSSLTDDAYVYPSGNIAVGRVMLLQAILHASGLDEIREVQGRVNVPWK